MRYISRVERTRSNSYFVSLRDGRSADHEDPGLSAFRGLLVAASMSALFWGVCLTALWLLRTRG